MTTSAKKILLVEAIHPIAKEILTQAGHQVDLLTYAPDEKEWQAHLQNYDLVGIRSKSELTQELLSRDIRVSAIGCFCIGTNQVALNTANAIGIPVFNAPHSNTRSVAELVLAEMIALSRQLGDRNREAHRGGWMKSAVGSREVRGKTLGIIGYGHIGTQVSILAEALGLRVIFYDVQKKLPLGNASPCQTLDELLQQSDFVTLHVPETTQTKEMIGQAQLAKMKKGSYLLNLSRGTVVVIEDLVAALKSGHLAGCAIDVFPAEPASNKEAFVSPLQNVANVILTPHIGGSTEEAQYNIGIEVAESFRRFLERGATTGAVQFPQVDQPLHKNAQRILNVHRNEPGVLGEINSAVSKHGANIIAQTLVTDESIGYLVMDVEKAEAMALSESIKQLPRSIRTRLLR